jgi:hypothetical protein
VSNIIKSEASAANPARAYSADPVSAGVSPQGNPPSAELVASFKTALQTEEHGQAPEKGFSPEACGIPLQGVRKEQPLEKGLSTEGYGIAPQGGKKEQATEKGITPEAFKTSLQGRWEGQAPEQKASPASPETGLPGKGEETAREEGISLAGILSGESILRSMPGYTAASLAEPAAPPAGRTAAAENLVSEIAERILVSETDKNGSTAEVRINIKNSVLPDTEIILRREGDRLNVVLLTANASSHRTLLEAEPALRELLLKQGDQKEENLSVKVALREDRQQGQERERRSRGLDYLEGVER